MRDEFRRGSGGELAGEGGGDQGGEGLVDTRALRGNEPEGEACGTRVVNAGNFDASCWVISGDCGKRRRRRGQRDLADTEDLEAKRTRHGVWGRVAFWCRFDGG